MRRPIIVLKFGGSILTSETSVDAALSEIYRFTRQGYSVLAVVSALQGETDHLLALGRRRRGGAGGACLPYLVALGEQRSAALLALAAERIGLATMLASPHEVALRAVGSCDDATLISVNEDGLQRALARHDLVVLPGFVATDDQGRTVLLGRGGTDFSAVFLAERLDARVRLLKDVQGVYERDPAEGGPVSGLYATVTWAEAERVAHPLVQEKAIRYAADHRAPIEVAALGSGYETLIGPGPNVKRPETGLVPLRVGLLGCGVVGGGLVERLLGDPARFDLRRVLVRDVPGRVQHAAYPVLSDDVDELLSSDIDVFVDVGCGLEPSGRLAQAFLGRGVHVVSANKQAVASGLPGLRRLSAETGAEILYSAAVGGGAPVLEAAHRARPDGVVLVEGVLNGTSNFILGRCGQGASLSQAVVEAQTLGFAEADPTQDLDGRDAAAKLQLLSYAAFGQAVAGEIARSPLTPETTGGPGPLKQIARCWRDVEGEVRAEVRLESKPPGDFLAGALEEENRCKLVLQDGREIRVSGKGAGRWPTCESVLADLLDLARRTSPARSPARKPSPGLPGASVEPPRRHARRRAGPAALITCEAELNG